MKDVSLAIRNMQTDITLRFTAHSSQNGYHEENEQQQVLVRVWEREALT